MKKMLLRKPWVIIVLFVSILFSSCIPQKRILYFQDKDKEAIQNEWELKSFQYRVKPGDELYIRVISLNKETSDLFNSMMGQTSAGNLQYGAAYLVSYTVDDSGYIDFPYVGKIQVQNKTLEEIKSDLQAYLSDYLKYASVVVKLVNYKISVLGEVKNPGEFDVFNDNITLLEALALAGDLTDYGNRNKIMLIRQENGKQKVINLDISDKNILNSEYFYLLPNDVIYVPPMVAKAFGLRNFQLQTFLSLGLSALAFISYLQTLKK